MHRVARNQNHCHEDCALCGVKMSDSNSPNLSVYSRETMEKGNWFCQACKKTQKISIHQNEQIIKIRKKCNVDRQLEHMEDIPNHQTCDP